MVHPAFDMELTEQQNAIADAAIRVIARDGFDVVSVRSVAEESGVTAGTVQYHFRTRQDILIAALVRSVNRQISRISARHPAHTIHERIHAALLELLPIDDERREDAIVWVTYGAAASTRSWLAEMYLSGLEVFRDQLMSALETAQAIGALQPGVDPATGARLISAMVNGLDLDFINAPAEERALLPSILSDGLALFVRPGVSITEQTE